MSSSKQRPLEEELQPSGGFNCHNSRAGIEVRISAAILPCRPFCRGSAVGSNFRILAARLGLAAARRSASRRGV